MPETHNAKIRLTKEGARTITYNVKVTVLDPSDDATIGSIVVKGQTAVKDETLNESNGAVGYRVDLTWAQANDPDTIQATVTPADKNASIKNKNAMSTGITAFDGTSKGVVNAGKFYVRIAAENGVEGDEVVYAVTINVAAQPAQKADVKLTEKANAPADFELTGNGDTYEILTPYSGLSGNALANRITGNGTTDSNIDTVIKGATAVNNVFTLTFEGVANGEDQVITLTVKPATDEQKATRDLADVEATYANGSKLAVDLTSDLSPKGVEAAVEQKIAGTGTWQSTITADATYVGDNWDSPDQDSMSTGEVQVVITVKSGDVTKTFTTTLSVQGTNANR